MKKLYLFLIIIFTIGLISGCNAPKKVISESFANTTVNKDVEKIEVYHFHGANQCFSCITIKEFAEKTVNTYYQDLLESGKMEFKSINGELPENREVTMKYGAMGSSLWIGTYIGGEFHKEQNTNVWYKVGDEADFTSYLKGVLDKRLSGDLS